MRKFKYQQIASKALKTMVLLTSNRIANYIPETRWHRSGNLAYMLHKYPAVYVKPDKGTGGGGIIRLKRISADFVQYQDLHEQKLLPVVHVHRWLDRKLVPNHRYILQRGISLAEIQRRPFDIRVLLQKPHDMWIISGMAAKAAAPGKIVTNYCKGGKPLGIFEALHAATEKNHEKAKKIFVELYYLSKEIAKILNRRFGGLKELGIDVGIDKQHKIWVFEVNTQPNFQMFRKLSNPKNVSIDYKSTQTNRLIYIVILYCFFKF